MTVYNHTITSDPQLEERRTSDIVLRWLALSLIVVGALIAWSNHFESSFHLDDVTTIVNNPLIHGFSNVPRFFVDPRAYDGLPRYDAYRPLLFASFAFDYRAHGADPRVFQFDTFFWFTAQLLLMYVLFRVLSGGNHYLSLFAATLYGIHPAMADTLDYILQRGEVLGAVGIAGGLALWISWPRRMPSDLSFFHNHGLQSKWDLTIRRIEPFLAAAYGRLIKTPLPLYVVPLLLALFANPASAIFALLLLVYVRLYEPETGLRRIIPASALCAGYWVLQAALTWRSGTPSRLPIFAYWYTQPWVAVRYLIAFFVPTHLSADSDLQPLAHFWSPQALLGYAGLAALVWIAIVAGRHAEWRTVSFGVWWFLIALIPAAIIPQQAVEADSRMYLPFAGLALAAVSTAFIGFEHLRASPRLGSQAGIAGPILAAALLPLLVWGTWERNSVWLSDESLWEDVIAKSPHNGHALMNYGLILISEYDTDLGEDYMARAAALLPHDAQLETNLALLAENNGKDADAENHFRRAIAFDPTYSPAYSYYGRWLLSRQRSAEAFDNATKAARLSYGDLVARHTLIDIYADRSDWPDLLRVANEALRLDSKDVDGQRALRVAQTGIDEVSRSEKQAKADPTPDHYLNLSVVYFKNGRYEDSIAAAREALKLHPDLAEAYFNIASVDHVIGRDDDAITALREVLRIKPDFEPAKNNLAYELAKKGEPAPNK